MSTPVPDAYGEVFEVSPPSPQDRLPPEIIRSGYSFHDKLPWGARARQAAAQAAGQAAVPVWPEQEYATLKYQEYADTVRKLAGQVSLMSDTMGTEGCVLD